MIVIIEPVRTEAQRAEIRTMVWEFFDVLKSRYPEMVAEIDEYIAKQNIQHQLADFEAYFIPPHGECFLAMLEGAPVGMVMIRPASDGGCELNRMYVREAARGHGVGRMLCQAVIEEARKLSYATVFLGALYRHVEALPLYRSLGFCEYQPQGGYRPDDKRVIHMRLDLT